MKIYEINLIDGKIFSSIDNKGVEKIWIVEGEDMYNYFCDFQCINDVYSLKEILELEFYRKGV